MQRASRSARKRQQEGSPVSWHRGKGPSDGRPSLADGDGEPALWVRRLKCSGASAINHGESWVALKIRQSPGDSQAWAHRVWETNSPPCHPWQMESYHASTHPSSVSALSAQSA